MKRLMALLLTLILMLGAVPASLGEGATGTGLYPEIAAMLTTGSLAGATILDFTELTGYGSDDCFFAVIRTSGGANWLYCFKRQADGTWKREFRTNQALPQTRHGVHLGLVTSGEEWPSFENVTTPHLYIMQEDEGGEYTEFCVTYALENHKWMLFRIWGYTGGWDHMRIREGHIDYYRELEDPRIAGTANGTIQRDIRYVNITTIPRTLAEARAKLTVAPSIPDSAELQVYPVRFTGSRQYDVFSAPDRSALRGANGRAAVSTNSWIQVFGTDGDWVLVHYSIDASRYRFGYITASSLPRNAGVPALHFSRTAAWTTAAVTLTDDPLYSRSPLLSLPAGARVDWLATLGDWAYVEVNQNDYARGFVPLNAVTGSRIYDLQNWPDGRGQAVYTGTLTVTHDDRMEAAVRPAAGGPLAGQTVAQILVTDTGSGSLLAVLQPSADGVFYGNCALGGDVTSLTLSAMDASGITLTAIRVEW